MTLHSFVRWFVLAALGAPAVLPAQATPRGFDLSIANIMRGPEHFGREPQNVTWSADDNDLVLSRLGEVTGSGGVVDVIPDHKAFRALASELGVVMSPKAMSPADTMGYSGFQFSTEFSINTINGNSPYWRAAQGADVTDPAAPAKVSPSSQLDRQEVTGNAAGSGPAIAVFQAHDIVELSG